MMNFIQLLEAIELSMIYSLVTIGVYLTFRVIDFPDLSVDGTFPLGAAVSSVMLINSMNPFLALALAFMSGGLAGLVTALLHVKGRIMELLSGILVMAALYSINLRIMGQPNIALLTEKTIFSFGFDEFTILALIALIIAIIITIFLNTEIGLALRASGVNAKSTKAQGINVSNMKIVGLSLSNALVALAGAIFAQKLGFADISMGAGTIIVGLASVIIGEKFLRMRGVKFAIMNCIIGAIVYRLAITLALNTDFLGLEASDLNLVTSIMVAIFMIAPNFANKIQVTRYKK
jgi:putative tryptophan/tyrosine transport system permease protein